MFPPGDERNSPKYWLEHGTQEQRRRAHAVLFRGTNSDHDRAFRSKVKKKYRERGIVAIVGEKLGRRPDVELRVEVKSAIRDVQENVAQPTRSDYETDIASRLGKKNIPDSTLRRYLDENDVKIAPRKPKP
jgi:hypothetical protein